MPKAKPTDLDNRFTVAISTIRGALDVVGYADYCDKHWEGAPVQMRDKTAYELCFGATAAADEAERVFEELFRAYMDLKREKGGEQ